MNNIYNQTSYDKILSDKILEEFWAQERKTQNAIENVFTYIGIAIQIGLSVFTGGGTIATATANLLGTSIKTVNIVAKSAQIAISMADSIYRTAKDVNLNKPASAIAFNWIAPIVEFSSLGISKALSLLPKNSVQLLKSITNKVGNYDVVKKFYDVIFKEMSGFGLSSVKKISIAQLMKANNFVIKGITTKSMSRNLLKELSRAIGNMKYIPEINIAFIYQLKAQVDYFARATTQLKALITGSLKELARPNGVKTQALGRLIDKLLKSVVVINKLLRFTLSPVVKSIDYVSKKLIKYTSKKFISPINRAMENSFANFLRDSRLLKLAPEFIKQLEVNYNYEALQKGLYDDDKKGWIPNASGYLIGYKLFIYDRKKTEFWTNAIIRKKYNAISTAHFGERGAIPEPNGKLPLQHYINFQEWDIFINSISLSSYDWNFFPKADTSWNRKQTRLKGQEYDNWFYNRLTIRRTFITLFGGVSVGFRRSYLAFNQTRKLIRNFSNLAKGINAADGFSDYFIKKNTGSRLVKQARSNAIKLVSAGRVQQLIKSTERVALNKRTNLTSTKKFVYRKQASQVRKVASISSKVKKKGVKSIVSSQF